MAGKKAQFIRGFTVQRLSREEYAILMQRTKDVADSVKVGWYKDGRLYLLVTSETAANMLDQALREIVGFTQYRQHAVLPSKGVMQASFLTTMEKLPAPPKDRS